MIIVVTGPRGAGKSLVLEKVAESLRSRAISLGGVISRGLVEDGKRLGYELVCLADNRVLPLANAAKRAGNTPGDNRVNYGAYDFCAEALRIGNQAVFDGMGRDCLFVDEIGRWELEGGGWSRYLGMLRERQGPALLAIRQDMALAVAERWSLTIARIFDVHSLGIPAVIDGVLRELKKTLTRER
ncbi:hypothetical protein NB640_00175 [Oxalobacter vibrioformis]|uniref:Uncharacterized protein n=1 Tax=Oxalobacter vibrioformis TaxID=933080 RepID=A0A9E9P4H9_9BURK|nr:nucleoside-triphosphatase [Oxalobacter vibrioformis]WAW10126.1 hypothetical protein NB640_00175 [Oxalobacter vibrioformis]